ncbi:MAG: hypothetical protein OXC57_05785 [Rhodobacteraceae bacterium]|nr:hypothetical protein [Paracoccaceae bacterium]
MQVAAHEARKGNSDFAHDIRNLIDIERKKSSKKKNLTFQSELNGLVNIEESEISKQMLVLSEEINERIGLIIHEFRQQGQAKIIWINSS